MCALSAFRQAGLKLGETGEWLARPGGLFACLRVATLVGGSEEDAGTPENYAAAPASIINSGDFLGRFAAAPSSSNCAISAATRSAGIMSAVSKCSYPCVTPQVE